MREKFYVMPLLDAKSKPCVWDWYPASVVTFNLPTPRFYSSRDKPWLKHPTCLSYTSRPFLTTLHFRPRFYKIINYKSFTSSDFRKLFFNGLKSTYRVAKETFIIWGKTIYNCPFFLIVHCLHQKIIINLVF